MDLDTGNKKNKFSYFGEILPNNDRSNAIIAQRREEEQRRKEEAERVSHTYRPKANIIQFLILLCLSFVTVSINCADVV